MRRNEPAPHAPQPESPVRAQIIWWAPTFAITISTLVGGIASLLAAEPLGVTLGCFAITVVAGTGGLRAREQYRRGWRHGYESAVRAVLEHSAGRTPSIEVRAAVNGDPTPEPWDEHRPVVTVRRRP